MVRDCLILITSTFSYVVVVPKRHCLFLSIIIININKNFVESNNLLSLCINNKNMKLKQFILAVMVTVLAISCTKQDIVVDKKETLTKLMPPHRLHQHQHLKQIIKLTSLLSHIHNM